jgi:hypothetical protein
MQCETLASLLGRKGFSRVWIIQTVLVTKDMLPQCGSRRHSWFALVKLSQILLTRAVENGTDPLHVGTTLNAYMIFVNRVAKKIFQRIQLWLFDDLLLSSGFEAFDL